MTPIALTIAGTDPSGGAGIQADLKTFSALGAYGATVVTALVAQNTTGVQAIQDIPPAFIARQIDFVFDDLRVDALKIGMLSQVPVIETVAERLRHWRPRWIVLDPVMVAKSGDKLLADDAIDALTRHLLPLASIITPNLPEAGVLLGEPPARTRKEMGRVAARLQALGPNCVLLKGGHLEEEDSPDLLIHGGEHYWLEGQRVATRHTHGTGCTLSAAITALLARGQPCPRQSLAPSATSLRPSPLPTGSESGTATGRSTTSTPSGPSLSSRDDHPSPPHPPRHRRHHCRTHHRARPGAPHLAHDHLLAARPARPRHERPPPGRADHRHERRPSHRPAPRCGRTRARPSGVRRRERRCRRDGPQRRHLLDRQDPAAAYFTTVPWGLTPLEHIAWIEHGGGQALWDELYAPFGLKPFMAGSSGMQMGGWFRRELKSQADLKGLRIRAVGLSADVFQKLGAIAVVLPAGEIFPALQSGAVDGVEFLGPNSDRAQGLLPGGPLLLLAHLHQAQRHGRMHHPPRGLGHAGWRAPGHRRRGCPCREPGHPVGERVARGRGPQDLVDNRKVQLRAWPDDVLRASHAAAEEVLAEVEAAGAIEARIARAYREALTRIRRWSAVSAQAYLGARELA